MTYRRKLSWTWSPEEIAARFASEKGFVFLDQGRDEGYSFLGIGPRVVLESNGGALRLHEQGERPRLIHSDLFDYLEERFERGALGAFFGGAMGYLAYDLFEGHLPVRSRHPAPGLPAAWLPFFDRILCFDHREARWEVRALALMEGATPRQQAKALIAEVEEEMTRAPLQEEELCLGDLRASFTRDSYLASVEEVREEIRAGRVYQLNLSQRFEVPLRSSPWSFYQRLRGLNRARYGAFLNCGDHQVTSVSPELLLSRNGAEVVTEPIKGTRPRGRSPEEDERQRAALLSSEKEQAELSMIVDLERNDLGKVCQRGSVEVVAHREIRTLPKLFHTVSTVRGALRPEVGMASLLRAIFPGGSITGCPKIAALKTIDRLEPARRHVYSGAIGWIAQGGAMALSVAIRTQVIHQGMLSFQVGGGIVIDSDPAAEYQETLDKAAAIFELLKVHKDQKE